MIICADDYGMAPDINEAIIDLAQSEKISAVSVMILLPGVNKATMEPLLKLQDKIDIGLHLVFTSPDLSSYGEPLPAFEHLMTQCWLGKFTNEMAEREISAQYQIFMDKAGKPPDFIDGHMHVHQFPVIRQALLRFVSDIPGDRPYVRNTYLPLARIASLGAALTKTLVISIPGKKMRNMLHREGIETNDGFYGVYDFSDSLQYPEHLSRFIEGQVQARSLLMVHPGKVDEWRKAEYEAITKLETFPAMRYNDHNAGETGA